MKRNDIKALHDKTVAELQTQLQELQMSLAKARLEKKAGKLSDVSSISRMSDDIARIKTILTQKELMQKAEEVLKSLKAEKNERKGDE